MGWFTQITLLTAAPFAACVWATYCAANMTQVAPSGAAPTFRVDSALALVRLRVTAKSGGSDLRPDEVEIREDGVAQEARLFEGGALHPATVPVEVFLLFDASLSVKLRGPFDPSAFNLNMLDRHKNATVAVYAFSETLRRLCHPSRDPATLERAMAGVTRIPPYRTPLYRAILMTLKTAADGPASSVRTLAVVSDGIDTEGDERQSTAAARFARDNGIAVHPVMLDRRSDGPRPVKGQPDSDARSVAGFLRLGPLTGGEALELTDPAADVLGAIPGHTSHEMEKDYVVGFYPRIGERLQSHVIEVVLKNRSRGRITGGTRKLIH